MVFELLNIKYYSSYFYIYVTEEVETGNTPNYLELDKQYVFNNYVYQLSLKYPNYYYLRFLLGFSPLNFVL